MRRLGIVGCGSVGWRYLSVIKASAELRQIPLVLCDVDEQRLKRTMAEFDAERGESDIERLLDAGVDAIVNLTPTRLHEEISRWALSNDVHVFVEKPMATSAKIGRELASLADSRGLVLMAAPAMSLTAGWVSVRRAIESGDIGEPRYFRGTFSASPWPWRNFDGDPSWYFASDTGPLRDLGIYGLELAVNLFGPAIGVSSFMTQAIQTRRIIAGPRYGHDLQTEGPDVITVSLKFPDRRIATIEASYCVNGSDTPTVEVFGEWGTIVFDPYGRSPGLEIARVNDHAGVPEWSLLSSTAQDHHPQDRGGKFEAGIKEFIAATRRGSSKYLTAETACHLLDIIDAAYSSAGEGVLTSRRKEMD